MSSSQLPGVFGSLAPVLDKYGYLAVAAFVLLEDFGVPVPGETILIAAAVYAGTGRLDVFAVAIVAFLAAIAGDNIGFAIGHFGGRRLVLRWGRYIFLTESRLARAEDFVDRHGGKIVVVARFVEGLRQANGIVAGIAQMPWLTKFLPFNALGAALWVGVWVTVGDLAGGHIGTLYAKFHHYEIYVGIAVAVLVVAAIVRVVIRHRHGKARAVSPDADSSAVPESQRDS